MAFSLITSVSAGSSDGSNVTTGAVTTTGADLIVIAVASHPGSTFTVSDNKSNTYTLAVGPFGTQPSSSIYFCFAPTVGASHTFTMAGSSSFPSLCVTAWSGADTSAGANDQENGGGTFNTATVQAGSVTPTTDNQLVIAGMTYGGTSTPSIDGGFTRQQFVAFASSLHWGSGIAYLVQTTAAAANPTWSNGDTTYGGATIATFKAAPDTFVEQEGYRFRNDDGSETTATWKAAQDTAVTSPLSANLRLRMVVNATGDVPSIAYRLDYKKSTDSVYAAVPVGAGSSPTIVSTAETAVTTAGTSHAITLPGSIAATDLVMILMDIGSTSATLNALTDWTEDLDESAANGLKILRYTGSGVPSNPTFTSSASTRSASIAYRISGADKTIAPQIGTTATGTSTTPDPPSVTPTGGTSKPYLFIAFFGSAGEEADDDTWVTAAPTNYTGLLQKACGTVGTNLGGLIGAASRQLTTGSAENPATFTMAVSAAWRAQTIIIHPSPVPIYISTSANITAGGEATTAQLTAPAGKTTSDFVTGRMWDDENGADSIDITADDYTELEWSLQAQSPAVDTDVYQFRVTKAGTDFDTYTLVPSWTIGTPAVTVPPPIPRRRMALTYR